MVCIIMAFAFSREFLPLCIQEATYDDVNLAQVLLHSCALSQNSTLSSPKVNSRCVLETAQGEEKSEVMEGSADLRGSERRGQILGKVCLQDMLMLPGTEAFLSFFLMITLGLGVYQVWIPRKPGS